MQKFADIYDPMDSMRMMVKEVRQAIDSDLCAIYLLDVKNDQYVLLASEGFKPGVDGKLTIKRAEGLVGWVGNREEPINLDNASVHPHFKYFPETGEEIYHAFMGVPIIHQRDLLGVLVVQQKTKRKFDESEEAFLITIAVQLGTVLASVKLSGVLARLANNKKPSISNTIVHGIAGSGASGMVAGKAVLAYMPTDLNIVPDRKISNIDAEIELFKTALETTKAEIRKFHKNLSAHLPPEELLLFEAYIHILEDSTLSNEIIAEISLGNWAQGSIRKIIKRHVSLFDHIDDLYIKERALDIRDLGQRLLSNLQKKNNQAKTFPDNTILVSKELTVASLAEVPSDKLTGVVSIEGSPNSHMAIVARALNIPAVMGVKKLDLDDIDGKELVLDAYNGQVYIEPDKATRKRLIKLIEDEKTLYSDLERLKNEKAQTLDSHTISLFVNTGMLGDIFTVISHAGSDGVGLYRTEVPFMMRDRFPSEQEQRLLYKKTLENVYPLPVIMRTLDIGGDKNLSYFPIEEMNPFLGWRGIRVTLDHPEIFLVQVRAMLSASYTYNNLAIMLPMVTNLNELIDAKKLIIQVHQEVVDEGLEIIMPKIGILIEVPAAAYQIDDFIEHVDFLSVGTNDLTQYMLAVDRNNTRVSTLYDHFHPAVIKVLAHVAITAKKHNIPIGVCGEMAADPLAVILLLAMEYTSLSMNYNSLAKIKWVIRNLNLSASKQVLADVMKMQDAKQIKEHLKLILGQAGLGGLIRAGELGV